MHTDLNHVILPVINKRDKTVEQFSSIQNQAADSSTFNVMDLDVIERFAKAIVDREV